MAVDPLAKYRPGAGGSSSKKKKTLRQKAVTDLRDLWTSLPKLPKALGQEVEDILPRFGAKTGGPVVPSQSEFQGSVPRVRVPTIKTSKMAEQVSKGGKSIGKGQVKKGVTEILDAPGVRMVPGTYAGSQAIKGDLGDRPLFAALDVLPVVGKATRGVTLGTKTGRALASRVATRADVLGKVGKVEKVGARGLEPRQVVGEALRSAEDVVVRKLPTVERFVPSQLLERSGLGGTRLRTFMSELGTADRRMQNQAAQFVNETMGEAQQLGITRDRAVEISRMNEMTPELKNTLAPNEVQWLDSMKNKSDGITAEWVERGKLFKHDGEVYPVSERGLKGAIAEMEKLKEGIHPEQARIAKKLTQVQARLARAEAPLTKYSTRQPGTYQGQTVKGLQSERSRLLKRREGLVAKAGKQVDKASQRAVPARYMPMLRGEVAEAVRNLAGGSVDSTGTVVRGLDPESITQVVDHFLRRQYDEAGAIIGPEQVAAIRDAISTTWRTLREQGIDPVYMPHISPGNARRELLNPKLTRELHAPKSTKKRSPLSPEPHVSHMAVGVSAQGVDSLRYVLGEQLWATLREKRFVLTKEEAIVQVQHLINADVEKAVAKGIDLDSATLAARQRWLDRTFGKFAPESMFPSGPGGGPFKPGEWFLPKGLQRALSGGRMGILKQADLGKAARVAGIPGKVFRMSLLTFAPFYYAGNVVSTAVMLMAHNPLAPKFFGKARGMLKDGTLPEGLSLGFREASAETAGSIRRFKAAEDLKKILDQQDVTNKIPYVVRRIGSQTARVPGWLNNVANVIDDMGKTMAYLSESKKMLKKGYSKEAAEQLGIDLAHKVLVDFDRLTPLERTAIRSAIPFASWTSHINRFVLGYPFDHPARVAVTSALARNISNEWPEGLPERFKKDLFFDNNTKRSGLSNFLPMMNVPDLYEGEPFVLAGLLSKISPWAQMFAEFTGADPYTYAQPVFGAKRTKFDPVSGKEVAVRPSLPGKLLEVSPQIHQVWAVLSKDPEWVELAESNPEAARAAIWRSFGISIPRTLNIGTEIEKARVARERVGAKQRTQTARNTENTNDPLARYRP